MGTVFKDLTIRMEYEFFFTAVATYDAHQFIFYFTPETERAEQIASIEHKNVDIHILYTFMLLFINARRFN